MIHVMFIVEVYNIATSAGLQGLAFQVTQLQKLAHRSWAENLSFRPTRGLKTTIPIPMFGVPPKVACWQDVLMLCIVCLTTNCSHAVQLS